MLKLLNARYQLLQRRQPGEVRKRLVGEPLAAAVERERLEREEKIERERKERDAQMKSSQDSTMLMMMKMMVQMIHQN